MKAELRPSAPSDDRRLCGPALLPWRSRLQHGVPQSTESVATIADGIAVRVPVPEALADLWLATWSIRFYWWMTQALIEAMQLVFRRAWLGG